MEVVNDAERLASQPSEELLNRFHLFSLLSQLHQPLLEVTCIT